MKKTEIFMEFFYVSFRKLLSKFGFNNLILEETKNIVIPHFKKNMAASGMVGWGLGLKVTPQGTDYASMMTYDV